MFDRARCGLSLGGGELGHCLGALRHGMLGQLARQNEADGGLDLTAGHSRLLAVAGQLCSLGGNFLKLVLAEGVQDGDGLGADAGVGVHLLQDLVDVYLQIQSVAVVSALHCGGQA